MKIAKLAIFWPKIANLTTFDYKKIFLINNLALIAEIKGPIIYLSDTYALTEYFPFRKCSIKALAKPSIK